MAESSPDNWPGTPVGSQEWPGKPLNASTSQEKPAPTLLNEAVAQKQQQAITGIKRGIAGGLGLPGDITEFIGQGIGSTTGRALPTSEEVTQGMAKLGIEPPKGASDKVVEFLANPLSYLGGGAALGKILGAGGAGVGAEVGEKVGGTPGEIIGSLAGGSLAGLKGGKPLSVGMETPANRQAAADYLASEGVTALRAGQQTGSKALQRAEEQLGTAPLSGGVSGEKFGEQMRQFTRAALKRVGENADEATPAVIDRAFTRIGKDFDRLQDNVLLPDQQFKNEIAQAHQDYFNTTSSPVPYAKQLADQVAGLSTSMGVPGKAYKALRSKINETMRRTTNPEFKLVLREYQNAIDDAMERTLTKTNPGELGKFREARRQYRNLLVLEKATTRAGESAREGLITPQALRSAVVGQSRRDFARGKGEFAKLASAGELLLTPPKSSGTAENIRSITLPGMAAGLGGRVLHSDFVQNLLKNRRQTPVALPKSGYPIRALINALGDRNASQ